MFLFGCGIMFVDIGVEGCVWIFGEGKGSDVEFSWVLRDFIFSVEGFVCGIFEFWGFVIVVVGIVECGVCGCVFFCWFVLGVFDIFFFFVFFECEFSVVIVFVWVGGLGMFVILIVVLVNVRGWGFWVCVIVKGLVYCGIIGRVILVRMKLESIVIGKIFFLILLWCVVFVSLKIMCWILL